VAGRAQEVRAWQTPIAFLGEISSPLLREWDLKAPVFYAEISLENLVKHVQPCRSFVDWPRYPAIERDLSLIVKDDVLCGSLMQEIRGLGEGLIRDVKLFDLFRGKRIPEGYRNLAFRIIYQSLERTLISDQVQKLHDRIAEILVKKYEATFQK
jgi:phenylalanyl-tRNA synthetase beta chain